MIHLHYAFHIQYHIKLVKYSVIQILTEGGIQTTVIGISHSEVLTCD